MKSYSFVIAFFSCVMAVLADPIELTHTVIEGRVSYSSNGTYPFRVEVRQTNLDKVVYKQKHYFGHYEDQRAYVCSSVSISLNDKQIEVPKAAYLDLCYLQSIRPPELMEDGRWMFAIEGGSAGESYEVQLIFSDSKVVERRLAFDESAEKKTYNVRKF